MTEKIIQNIGDFSRALTEALFARMRHFIGFRKAATFEMFTHSNARAIALNDTNITNATQGNSARLNATQCTQGNVW